jgi:hypothetical protein
MTLGRAGGLVTAMALAACASFADLNPRRLSYEIVRAEVREPPMAREMGTYFYCDVL